MVCDPSAIPELQRLDPRPLSSTGWWQVLVWPPHWRRWLPRAALSTLCWLRGHRGRQVYLSGLVSVECSRCGMRLIVLRQKPEPQPQPQLRSLR